MSIRKRVWTTTRKGEQTAWLVDYTDQNKVRHVRQFSTKGAAVAFQNQAGVDVKTGEHVPINKQSATVAECGQQWLESATARGLEQLTVKGYAQHVKFHIDPFIGSMKISRVGVSEVQDLLNKLASSGRSKAMIRAVKVSLGSLFSEAIRRRHTQRNPVKDLGRGDAKVEKRHKREIEVGVDIPRLEEINAVVAALAGDRFRPFLLTAIFTGMRASELRGLRWADVDFQKHQIEVAQRADANLEIGSPKSKSGRRKIPMFDIVANALKEWRLACPKGELDLVFPRPDGGVETCQVFVRQGWWKAQLAAGVVTGDQPKYLGVHSLRHFFISWCLNPVADGGRGMGWQEVAKLAGHADIAMTLGVYSHLFPKEADRDAMRAAEAALLGPKLVTGPKR